MNQERKRKEETLKKTANILLSVLLFCMVALTGLSIFVQEAVVDTEKYIKIIVDDEYMELTMADIHRSLEAECLYLSIPVEEIIKGVDRQTVRQMCEDNTRMALARIFKDVPVSFTHYPASKLMPVVSEYLQRYSQENGVVVEKSFETDVVQALNEAITRPVNFINQSLLPRLPSFSKAYKTASRLAEARAFLMIAVGGTTVLLLFINRKKFFDGIFYVMSAVWTGVIAVSVPIWVMAGSEIEQKIRLVKSPLRVMFVNMMGDILHNATGITIAVTAAATVFLILAVVLRLSALKREGEMQLEEELILP